MISNNMKAAKIKGSIDHCVKDGHVSLAVTLRRDVAADRERRDSALARLAGEYGTITGNYPWDPTNIGMLCEAQTAKRLVDDFYANGKVDYIAKILVGSNSVVPCYISKRQYPHFC